MFPQLISEQACDMSWRQRSALEYGLLYLCFYVAALAVFICGFGSFYTHPFSRARSMRLSSFHANARYITIKLHSIEAKTIRVGIFTR